MNSRAPPRIKHAIVTTTWKELLQSAYWQAHIHLHPILLDISPLAGSGLTQHEHGEPLASTYHDMHTSAQTMVSTTNSRKELAQVDLVATNGPLPSIWQ
jgi:hypothetical protein